MPFKVFFSYAHRDEVLLEKLKEHLAPLKNQGLIDRLWYDREISGGTEWEPEIVRHLETADIILLLVSAAFMNSEYCYGKELQRAIQRHERREARVVPIILSPVDWQIPPLDKLQALPTDAKPVTGAGWHSVDEALLNVVKGIRTVIKDLQKHPRPGSSYQYHFDYVNRQVKQGMSPITALNHCDPELAKFVEWVIRGQDQSSTNALMARIEILLREIAAVGDGDLRVQAEVTPDTLGVIADAFNYLVEELTKAVVRTQSATKQTTNGLTKIVNTIKEQEQIAERLKQGLDALSKSSSREDYLQQFSKITILMTELSNRFDPTEKNIRYLQEVSDQLRASVSTFRLPEHCLSERDIEQHDSKEG